jgi:Glycosyl hydrolase family 12
MPLFPHMRALRDFSALGARVRALSVISGALVLAACGGAGSEPPAVLSWVESSLTCAANASTDIGGGFALVNNAWNASAAGTFAWTQCVKQRSSGGTRQFGWQWSWPPLGTQIHAYPEVVLGAKPWDAGPSTDSRLPRRVSALQRMPVSFEVDSTGTGDRNLAVSLWFTANGTAPAVPDIASISAEIMIWTDYTPVMLYDDGSTVKVGQVTVNGRVFDVHHGANWGGGTDAGVIWTYVAYVAQQTSSSFSFDAKAFIDDAVSRGFVNRTHYLASFELGNEVASGSGSTWVRSLSVGVE